MEDMGDGGKWDWSTIKQRGRALDGERFVVSSRVRMKWGC